jgi:hypothetical protein
MTQKTDSHLSQTSHSDPAYLAYAPKGWKELWETLDDSEKEKVKQHWEFTSEGPTWKGEVN